MLNDKLSFSVFNLSINSKAIDDPRLVIDHNFVLDVLPSRTIDALHEVAKSMVAARSEKECLDAYINCRRECLDECLLGLLKLKEGSIKDLGNIPYQNDMI